MTSAFFLDDDEHFHILFGFTPPPHHPLELMKMALSKTRKICREERTIFISSSSSYIFLSLDFPFFG
jgi:hypothetical protein